ncbi:hypothetical protein KP509_02G085100 [Ceratopteris richardii]|uniref:Transcription initiation factor TFIID subunit 12 domain-containing protein n=1 Tax=Ceratopteris richardii TaxID=49495 RepID=A0A8T2V839_CERRI|nr:hypothetical protein KP509_02G085100 [Ceratopteris richardii]
MAGEGVTSPPSMQQQQPSAPSQSMSVASPTGSNASVQQVSGGGAPPPSHQQPQLAVNLTQPQNFPQNQQTLNQISYAQQQSKPGAVGANRSLHTQYVQNVQNPVQSQQPLSPAMGVQSPPQTSASSMPRSSSASRIMQASPNAASLRATAPNAIGGQFVGSASLQQQQQLLASQRASQGQTMVANQQRPSPSGQTSHLQSGQMLSAGLVPGSSSMRSVYPSPYMQARPSMGGQMAMPMSSQYSALQQMHVRHKGGQVPASHYPNSGAPSSQLMGLVSPSSVGSQLTRPPGSVVQQSSAVNRMQSMQARQSQQTQTSQQLSQQQASPQIQKVPSMGSIGTGLQPSSQPLSSSSNLQNQVQQAWMQKPLNQAQIPYQGQPQQTQPSSMSQQHQLMRGANQRVTGITPGTAGAGNQTNHMGASNQSFETGNRILGKRSIQDLVTQVDPSRRLDPEVEDLLLDIADDFIESVTSFACKLAKHRKSNILEAKDVLLHLSRNWDLNIPGFNGEEYQTYKKTALSEVHKQRLALVKKSLAAQPGQEVTGAKAAGVGQPMNTTTTLAPQAPTNAQ